MEKFWAVILIFVVVAAAGLMYVNQVYIPQKDTQMAMADMANQTLSAVKLEIGDGTVSQEVSGSKIKENIEAYLGNGSTIKIIINGNEYDINQIDSIVEPSSKYYMKVTSDNGKITKISFTKI